jgi:hypothetical protein
MTKSPSTKPYALPTVKQAWELWHALEELSARLWDTYERPFIDICIADDETTPHRRPKHQSSEQEHEPGPLFP